MIEPICKTIFAVPMGDGTHKIRAYFKDLETLYIFNPLPYKLFDSQKEANKYLNREVKKYLKNKK
jgi:hypothetical protein